MMHLRKAKNILYKSVLKFISPKIPHNFSLLYKEKELPEKAFYRYLVHIKNWAI